MNVELLELTNFMGHDDTKISLDRHGTVLVTGPNGSGKSSFPEAVSWCLWGKTLRGAKPWRSEQECRVILGGDGIWVDRRRTPSGRTHLEWGYRDEEARDFDTASKAQEALVKVVGTFDTWRKTHVLTAEDVGDFARSADASRKRLLEDLLGIERIDDAYKAAGVDLREAEIRLTEADAHLRALLRGRDATKMALDALDIPGTVPAAPDPQRLQTARQQLSQAQADLSSIMQEQVKQGRRTALANAKLERLKSDARKLHRETCPTCGQKIPHSVKVEIAAECEAAAKTAQEADTLVRVEAANQNDAQEELVEEVRVLNRRVIELESADRDYEKAKREAKKRTASRERLEGVLDDNRKEIKHYKTQKKQEEHRIEKLKVVRSALGVKGFRAHLLEEATGAIETLTNHWLQIMGAPMAIRLDLNSKLCVELEVIGVAGDQGYLGASSGEKRRMDVAILLALSELANSSRTQEAGTLFLDEVFDSLDSDGISGVCDVMEALSSDRSVVVITHLSDLQGTVETAQHITL
jgi:DNA repair exonuclease SbcCD ATPase subunit